MPGPHRKMVTQEESVAFLSPGTTKRDKKQSLCISLFTVRLCVQKGLKTARWAENHVLEPAEVDAVNAFDIKATQIAVCNLMGIGLPECLTCSSLVPG